MYNKAHLYILKSTYAYIKFIVCLCNAINEGIHRHEERKKMKGKQSLNELEKMMNIVTSSSLNGRNIKYQFMFAICNVLLFRYLAYKQKTFKDKKDGYEGSSIRFYSVKETLFCTRFHRPS